MVRDCIWLISRSQQRHFVSKKYEFLQWITLAKKAADDSCVAVRGARLSSVAEVGELSVPTGLPQSALPNTGKAVQVFSPGPLQ